MNFETKRIMAVLYLGLGVLAAGGMGCGGDEEVEDVYDMHLKGHVIKDGENLEGQEVTFTIKYDMDSIGESFELAGPVDKFSTVEIQADYLLENVDTDDLGSEEFQKSVQVAATVNGESTICEVDGAFVKQLPQPVGNQTTPTLFVEVTCDLDHPAAADQSDKISYIILKGTVKSMLAGKSKSRPKDSAIATTRDSGKKVVIPADSSQQRPAGTARSAAI